MDWKLWYGDGSSWSSDDGDWHAAPVWGVQALVVLEPETGWFIEEGSDGRVQAYVDPPWTDHPIGVDYFGLTDYLLTVGLLDHDTTIAELTPRELADAGVKLGRTISTAEFHRIRQAATDDPDLPPKSARREGERAP